MRRDRDLASGPAKVCQALGIDRALDGVPLQRGPLVIREGTPVRAKHIVCSARIGLNPKSPDELKEEQEEESKDKGKGKGTTKKTTRTLNPVDDNS